MRRLAIAVLLLLSMPVSINKFATAMQSAVITNSAKPASVKCSPPIIIQPEAIAVRMNQPIYHNDSGLAVVLFS